MLGGSARLLGSVLVVAASGLLQFGLGFADPSAGKTMAWRATLLVVWTLLGGFALGVLGRAWPAWCVASCWGAVVAGVMLFANGNGTPALAAIGLSVLASLAGGAAGAATNAVRQRIR